MSSMLGTKYLWMWYMNTGLKCKKVKERFNLNGSQVNYAKKF